MILPNKNEKSSISSLIVDEKELTHMLPTLQQRYWPIVTISYLKQRLTLFLPTSGPLIYHYLKERDQSKATGCDRISVKALKLAAPNISQSLYCLFNESLRTGQFQSVWKIAMVAPLFKGGSPTDCDNYRPISVLPCISKIMESFVKTDLRNFAHEVGLIEQHQFAYSKFSSTTVALLKVVGSWKFAIVDGLKSVCVFLDLRKVFDVMKM